VLRHTVPAALSRPVTASPPVRTVTLVIVPPTAVTLIPRSGAVSGLPPAGVIDTRTLLAVAVARAPALAWLPVRLAADLEPPE